MALHFISDLHLDPARPGISGLFRAYLAGPARQADALYIIGDLFEVWVDDAASTLLYQQDIAALRQLSDSGVAVYFICGNRDFLCGQQFAKDAGLSLLAEPYSVSGNPHIMLMHGDSLCTDDVGYQLFRRFVRQNWVQWLYHCLPGSLKQGIADRIRGRSKSMTQLKAQDILDVNDSAVEDFFHTQPKCQYLIHGHTHRPAEHKCSDSKLRIVLSDWSQQHGEYLTVSGQSWQRHPIKPDILTN